MPVRQLAGLLEYATNEQGVKSVTKALKEGGDDTLDRVIKRMCEPAKGYVRSLFSWSVGNWTNHYVIEVVVGL